eukprot:NODE_7_length_67686_cov_1.621421.p56 type:complete len:117 gc:universal NODE_7_length_67686_cov_1.621421:4940-5290(+)
MFKERVASDLSEENILFYEAFQSCRIKCDMNQLISIFEMFIEREAPYELNINESMREDCRMRLQKLKNENKVDYRIFEEIAMEVEILLYQNSFPRFVDTCRSSEFTLNGSRKSLSK